jgi:hypothetical protein
MINTDKNKFHNLNYNKIDDFIKPKIILTNR